jgi:alkylation response protein AidB-like acyl-CoA dehydrogenase
LIEQAQAVAARIAGRAREFESLRRLPDDVAALLAESGLLSMLTPARYGGGELHPAAFFAAIEHLARTDASVAWCCFISNTSCLHAAYLDDATAAPIFGRAGLKAAGVFAPRGTARRERDGGREGFRVSGRWAWGSFAQHADVISAGCLVEGEPGPPLSVLLDREQVRVLDNWDSVGLAGTGSGEFEVDGAFVPASRTASLVGGRALARPLYRFPVFGLLALSIAAVAAGIARSAIDELVTLAAAKVPQGGTRVLAQRPAVQEAVARAEARLRAARAFALEAVHAAWAAAQHDAPLPERERRDLRLASTHLVHQAAAVVDRMFTQAGGSAVFAASPLQRALRDVRVATQHMMVAEATYELCGRLLLGMPTDTAQL